MNIVIAGAGEVGFHIAKLLSVESQNIMIIDIDKERLQKIENKLDVFTYVGDVTSFQTLREANVDKCDIFIAVTQRQSDNLTSALIAKKLGAKKTIARINNPEYLKRENTIAIQRIGIDSIISPEDLAAKEIYEVIEESAFSEVHPYENRILTSYAARLDKDADYVLGKTVKEVSDTFKNGINFMPIAIIREDENKTLKTIIPRGETKYILNDKVYFLGNSKAKNELYKLLGKENDFLKNIVILGGGRIGKKVARHLLKSKHSVVIVERDRAIAEDLAERFPKTLIICGDGRDADILDEAGVRQSDAFVGVTGRSETNIVSSLLAKNYGVKKTIALVENVDYISLSEEAGISTFVNKKLLAANSIFKHVRRGDVLDVFHLSELDAEILEFKIDGTCGVSDKPISSLNFPKKAIIGGIIREGKGYIPDRNFEIKKGDIVIVFSMPEDIAKVEKLFTKK